MNPFEGANRSQDILYDNLGTEICGFETSDVIAVLERLLKEMREEGNIHCR